MAYHLKVANPARLVAKSSPARAGAQRSEREKGGDFAPAGSKGRSPWRFFGDFLIGEKVTRVQGGAPAYRGAQGPPPRTNSPGDLGRSAQIRGRRGHQPRTNSPGDLGRSAQIRGRRGHQPRTNSPRGQSPQNQKQLARLGASSPSLQSKIKKQAAPMVAKEENSFYVWNYRLHR